MNNQNKQARWAELDTLSSAMRSTQATPSKLNEAMSVSACNLTIDFSRQLMTPECLAALSKLADACKLKSKINDLLSGAMVNTSEKRPALHTALRAPSSDAIYVDGQNVMPEVTEARCEIERISSLVRDSKWLGYSGMPVTDIVNIGIGGSDLGPRFCIQALRDQVSTHLNYHFVSDVDPLGFEHTVRCLNPETTLFIISSKSFTTTETLYNAKKALAWIGHHDNAKQHFIAVTANPSKAGALGFDTIIPIWDWVGGRYSFCSAINLISAIALGYDAFESMLSGARQMDKHFQTQNFSSNLPVLLALLGVWNINFLSIHNHLMLAYAAQLEQLVPYVQQLDMESNGKSIDQQGKAVNHATGPIVWGGLGNQAQHSYYQLLCQGTHKVAADIITLKAYDEQIINNMASAKVRVLSNGVNAQENPAHFIPGHMPINQIELKDCTPFTIGALVAMYEHKIFTQSVIWGINPFDQPGIESAKQQFKTKAEVFELS
jgi:glucose-6-phosphate isomerase